MIHQDVIATVIVLSAWYRSDLAGGKLDFGFTYHRVFALYEFIAKEGLGTTS